MNNKSKKSSTISNASPDGGGKNTNLSIEIVSFGFKNGTPPPANIMLDVRFLKNPFWVEELRPLTGLDAPVRKYVLDQRMAQDVLDTLSSVIEQVAPAMFEAKTNTFIIALGCTGGQHRSPAMVEALGERLASDFPQYKVSRNHRELEGHPIDATDTNEDGEPIADDAKLTAPRAGKSR